MLVHRQASALFTAVLVPYALVHQKWLESANTKFVDAGMKKLAAGPSSSLDAGAELDEEKSKAQLEEKFTAYCHVRAAHVMVMNSSSTNELSL